jgi:hypothetical protein
MPAEEEEEHLLQVQPVEQVAPVEVAMDQIAVTAHLVLQIQVVVVVVAGIMMERNIQAVVADQVS